MKRAPVYHEKNSDFRICSMGNDVWQYQKNTHKDGLPHFDPWQGLMRPTSYQNAKMQMDTLTPVSN